MRVYVAGPMTGYPNYNFSAFAEATARLRAAGYEVISPAEHDEDMDWVVVERDGLGGILRATNREDSAFDWHAALDWDLKAIDRCDAIYLLPGWSKSRGATKEYEHARRTGKHILGAFDEGSADASHQPLVGLVGYAQSGKDTFAGVLGYRRLAFADPLKQLAVASGPRFYEFHDPDAGMMVNWSLGAIVTQYGWEFAKANVPGVRQYLQDLGVGARDVLDPDVWVKAAFANYDPTQPTVITDVRFPNEIAAIKARGGVIVRIDRPGVGPVNTHVSEFAWQDEEPYTTIWNDGGISDLRRAAYTLDSLLRGVTV